MARAGTAGAIEAYTENVPHCARNQASELGDAGLKAAVANAV